MIDPQAFLQAADRAGIRFFTGVPDSLLKEVCACITATLPAERHQIASNEGSATGLAIGHYLATRQPALVYMQNSGLGNVVNPITSLASPDVYGIPMLLLVGWRGEMLPDGTQLKDEPQHVHQGRVTLEQLDVLGVPYRVLSGETTDTEAGAALDALLAQAIQRNGPVALVIRKNTFSAFKKATPADGTRTLSREQAIALIAEALPADSPVVSTTGMASRELYEIRQQRGQGHEKDFLTVGGMGHAVQIAAGMAQAMPGRQVACVDGDGAMLMHSGALAISAACPNLLHVVINNGAHDSVGGQPTPTQSIRLCDVARSFGYRHSVQVDTPAALQDALRVLLSETGSRFIEVLCRKGARPELGRPAESPAQNKAIFMDFLQR